MPISSVPRSSHRAHPPVVVATQSGSARPGTRTPVSTRNAGVAALGLVPNRAKKMEEYTHAKQLLDQGSAGDLGSTGFWIGQLKTLARELGLPPLSPRAEARYMRQGSLRQLDRYLSAARYSKEDPGAMEIHGRKVHLGMNLDLAIGLAGELKLTSTEFKALLASYRLTSYDVEANTEYKFGT